MRELYKVMKVSDEHVTVLELVGYLGAVLYYIAMKADFGNYGTMAIIISMILILFVYVFGYPKYHAEQVMAAFFGVVYVAVMLSFIYLTRSLPDGKFLVWLIFLCSWGCDTCAYCVGMLIGKHKMAPVLSPKKSIEGAAVSYTHLENGEVYVYGMHITPYEKGNIFNKDPPVSYTHLDVYKRQG